MLQRLPIALMQVWNLPNEIREIIYSLYQSSKIIKKLTIKWIQYRYHTKWVLYL